MSHIAQVTSLSNLLRTDGGIGVTFVVFPYLNGLLVLLTRPAELPGELLEGQIGSRLGMNGPGQFIIRQLGILRIKFPYSGKIEHFLSFGNPICCSKKEEKKFRP
ncbi:hypothetical protein Bwad005_00960 [Bilophila wadsworthia]